MSRRNRQAAPTSLEEASLNELREACERGPEHEVLITAENRGLLGADLSSLDPAHRQVVVERLLHQALGNEKQPEPPRTLPHEAKPHGMVKPPNKVRWVPGFGPDPEKVRKTRYKGL